MSKSGFAAIQTRTKLGLATKAADNGKGEGANALSKNFARNAAQHDVTIVAHKSRRTRVFNKLLKHTTTPLQWGGSQTSGLENEWKIQTRKEPGKPATQLARNTILTTRTKTGNLKQPRKLRNPRNKRSGTTALRDLKTRISQGIQTSAK